MRTFGPILGLALVLTACPGDDGGGGGSEGSESGSGESGTTAGTSGASQSETTTGTATQSGTSAGTGESGADAGTGPADSTGAVDESAGSSGGGDPCVGLSREECNANEACMAISCSPYEMTGAGVTPWCLGDPGFIGCQSADIGCDDVRTIACMGDDAQAFACPSSCIPVGWNECAPPVDGEVPMCM